MKKILLVAVVIALSMSGLYAQKLKTISGSPDVLKNNKNVKVIFTYENLKVGKMEESDYIAREIKERDDKEAGTGEIWAGKWNADKVDRYPPKFVKLFNQYGGDLFGAEISEDAADATVTIKVNISWIEPGFNIGVTRKPAGVNMEIYVFETATPDKILHELTLLNAPGSSMGNDYDAGERIGEAYAKAAKEYAKFIASKHLN